jgi:hypothetical protein
MYLPTPSARTHVHTSTYLPLYMQIYDHLIIFKLQLLQKLPQ